MKSLKIFFDQVQLLEPNILSDDRGYFVETFRIDSLKTLNIKDEFVQDNHSMSVKAGTLRGLHFQNNPSAQSKLVRVISGAILDVVVDIRKNSRTFGKYIAEILSSENFRQLYVPEGFAHGFVTLVPDTAVSYKVNRYYSKSAESSILWNDPEINIDWPFSNPILSQKDLNAPLLSKTINHFEEQH